MVDPEIRLQNRLRLREATYLYNWIPTSRKHVPKELQTTIFFMDVWWNNHFSCKELESSNWNNKFKGDVTCSGYIFGPTPPPPGCKRHKWRSSSDLGNLKSGIILVVTVAGWGVDTIQSKAQVSINPTRTSSRSHMIICFKIMEYWLKEQSRYHESKI